MAVSDVHVTISGPLPLKPIGVEMTYAVNAVPVCEVLMDPTESTILQDPDSYKRQGLITVTINVKGSTISFVGYFDGISVSQSMGGISYAAILKGQAQLLLEADTVVPGLSPYGMNPFAAYSPAVVNPGSNAQEAVINMKLGEIVINLSQTSFADSYKQLAITCLTYQIQPISFEKLISNQIDTGLNVTNLKEILSNPGRLAKMQKAIDYLKNLDTTSLAGLTDVFASANIYNAQSLINLYINGSRMLWENMVSFYDVLGAVLIPANNSIIVVPNNGFITFPPIVPGMRQHSTITNAAYPADYNSFNYNDKGYVDVGYVALIANQQITAGQTATYPAFQGGYPSKSNDSVSAGAAVVILDANPIVYQAADSYFNSTLALQNAQSLTANVSSSTTGMGKIGAGNIGTIPASNPSSVEQKSKTDYYQNLSAFGDNYAQLKFLQLRYGDRMGSITSRFNPNWCPGTVGQLFSRGVGDSGTSTQGGAGIFLNFMVQSITHSISLSPPNGGTATTNISFNCGRLGVNSFSIPNDPLYNYGYSQVQTAQAAFLKDVGAVQGS